MEDDSAFPSWEETNQRYLHARSDYLLGPDRETTDDHDEVGFRVTWLPSGETVVTLTETCNLATVHDLCHLIAQACLAGDEDINFTRDPTEADTRLHSFGQ